MSETLFPESSDDNVPALLPIQDDPLSPDDAFRRFEEALAVEPDSDDLIVVEAEPPPLGRSWAYDFQGRRFQASATARGPLETHGESTLKVWIEKCLRTARGAHPIYTDFGIELPADFFGGPVNRYPADEFRDRAEDALTRHPRIAGIDDFVTDYDLDEEFVAATFQVVTDTGLRLPIENVRLGV
jgi:hypothetical protein